MATSTSCSSAASSASRAVDVYRRCVLLFALVLLPLLLRVEGSRPEGPPPNAYAAAAAAAEADGDAKVAALLEVEADLSHEEGTDAVANATTIGASRAQAEIGGAGEVITALDDDAKQVAHSAEAGSAQTAVVDGNGEATTVAPEARHLPFAENPDPATVGRDPNEAPRWASAAHTASAAMQTGAAEQNTGSTADHDEEKTEAKAQEKEAQGDNASQGAEVPGPAVTQHRWTRNGKPTFHGFTDSQSKMLIQGHRRRRAVHMYGAAAALDHLSERIELLKKIT